MKNIIVSNILEKRWPIFLITLLWFVFSFPFFFQGKIPFAGDYQVTFFPPWSQYAQFNQPVRNSAMPDVIDQLYPWKSLVIDSWKHGQIPLWNPYNFAGTPLLANYQSSPFSPMNSLFFILPFKLSWGLLVLFQPLLAGIAMYLFVRKLSISQVGSTISSVGFMFCGFIVCWMGYGTLGYTVGVLPLVLLGLEGYLIDKKFRYILLSSLGLAFSFLSGHFQMSLYVLLASVGYFLFRYIPTKNSKTILSGFGSIIIGLLLAAPQIFPSIAFYSQSLRSTLFQRPEIIPWQYVFTFLAPDFFGNPVTRNDWFGHYAEWTGYIGVIPLLFGLFSLSQIKKNKFIVFFSLLAVLSLLLATPNLVGDLVAILHIPVLSTSAAGRIIVLVSFSLSILAGIGYDAWVKSKKNYVLSIISLGFLLLGWGFIFGNFGLSREHALIARQNFLLPSMFLAIIAVCSILLLFVKHKSTIFLLSLALLLLSCFDSYRFATKWQSFSPQNLIFPEIGITKFFQTIQNERAFGNYGGQVSLFYKLPTIEGYDALYPEKIGEFVQYVANGNIRPASRSVVEFSKNGRYAKEALDLLGFTYLIHKISDTGKPWTFPVEKYSDSLKIVYKDDVYIVFENTKAFPRAFLVNSYIYEQNKQKALETLFSKNFDREKSIVLELDPKIIKSNSLKGNALITSSKPSSVIISTESNFTSLLFLSDTYFPGWHAYIDGKETTIYKADYAFRAVVVPSGKHTVTFTYMPLSFALGVTASLAGFILLIGLYFLNRRVS